MACNEWYSAVRNIILRCGNSEVKLVRRDVPDRPGVQSVDMTLKVLVAVAQGPGPRPLKDISAGAGIAPSSAHRHLATLARAGMVEQNDATGRYDLGPLVIELGLLALARRDPVRLIGSSLEELRDRLDETVFLAVWGNRGPTIVRWEESARSVTVNVRVGSVLPLMRSATGRVFLTWLPANSTADLLQKEKAASNMVEVLRRATRRRGLGCVEGDLLPGVASLSAPVFNHQADLVAAISTLGPQGEFDTDPKGPIGKTLKSAASALSKRLGCSQSAMKVRVSRHPRAA
jgi:DNA-binding IclR family transcriptional regulator